MRNEDIRKLRNPGRPVVTADGTVIVAVGNPDVEKDRYVSSLLRLRIPGDGGSGTAPEHAPVEPFTQGPRDSGPVLSPDGSTLVFLRAQETGPAQLMGVRVDGGEPRKLSDHPLGASDPVFSPDGRTLAYLAAVPEPGRYGTDEEVGAEAEPPRSITRMSYRRDGKGFLRDKLEQVFVLSLQDGAEPVQVTEEPDVTTGPAFLPDGRLVYGRSTTPDRPQMELAVITATTTAGVGELLRRLPGGVSRPVVSGRAIYFLGAEFEGTDVAGRTGALWTLSAEGGELRRMTDVDVEVDAGTPVALPGAVLITVLDRGSISLRAVPVQADHAGLGELAEVIGGRCAVTSFSASGSAAGALVAAVVADPASPGEVVTVTVDDQGRVLGPPVTLTDLAADLRGTGLCEQVELAGAAPDGYPVHGWLVLPEGAGPHPVLLVVHGGPHAAYGWGLFDEAQVYASAGYAVVLPNPRGSSGYGHEHGRTLLGRLGTVDMDDVLALLDVALQRPDCDSGRVGVMGGSYGGFMTSWLASHAPQRFTAAISERAVNAWDSFAGSSDIGFFFAENYAGADRGSQWKASPLAYADDIALPLLIIHSEHDWRCPVEQAQRLFVALRRRGAETEMLLFPAEGHELSRSGRPRHRVDRFEAILGWWSRHLPVDRLPVDHLPVESVPAEVVAGE